MGWFSNLFKKEEKVEEIEIDFSKFDKWFYDNTKDIDEKYSVLLKDKKAQIEDIFSGIRQGIESLEDAKLRNPNISPKEIQYMEGNRNAYIKAVTNLIGRIDLQDMKKNSFLGFFEEYEGLIRNFEKLSLRPYHILSNFFADETSRIASQIKKLDNTIKSIKEDKSRKDHLNKKKVKSLFDELENNKKILSSFEKDMKEKHDKQRHTKEKLKEKKKELDDLRNSKAYTESGALSKRLSQKLTELKNLDYEINSIFSPLEKAFKKYAKVSVENEDIINSYLNKYSQALLEDKSFKIISVLDSIKVSINRDSLGLKDKKKEKTLQSIDSITKESLSAYSEKKKQKNAEINELKEEIRKLNITDKEEALIKKIDDLTKTENRISEDISELKSKKESISLENQTKKIIEKTESLLHVKITLV